MTAKKVKQDAEEKYSIRASYSFKRTIVDEICNGRISIRQASKKYQISRSSIDYWIKKFSTLEQKELFMGKKDELKKLKQRLEELEFIKDFQQDLIAEFEIETGKELAKKFLPEQLANEIEEKKKLIKRGS
jgi:transposase-like protein